jgi:hypothetical protein
VPGAAALPLADLVDHPADQLAGQLGGGHRLVAEQQRRVVAEPALEPAGQPVRLQRAAPGGRLADQQHPVRPEEQRGRHRVRAVAQRHDLRPPVPPDRRRRVRGADVDAEAVAHPVGRTT